MKKTLLMLLIFAAPALLSACGRESGDADELSSSAAPDDTSQSDDGHEDDGHSDSGYSDDGHEDGGHSDGGHGDDGHEDVGHSDGGHGDDGHEDGGHEGDDAHAVKPHGHDGGSSEHGHDSVAGQPGDPDNINRTVEVSLEDTMQFTPDQITVAAGDTVRFALKNNGMIPHEFVIGSMSELLEHAEMMRSMPTMQHAESNMVTLAAGEQGEVVWQFDSAGTVDFACLIPGHLEAGMKGSVTVE